MTDVTGKRGWLKVVADWLLTATLRCCCPIVVDTSCASDLQGIEYAGNDLTRISDP